MEKIAQTFEGLIRRSIAPSVTFLVIFASGELVAAELGDASARERLVGWLEVLGDNAEHASSLFALGMLLLVVGLSYGLSATQQVLFDNQLKRNFDPEWLSVTRWWPGSSAQSEGRALDRLREAVLDRLDAEPRLERFQPVAERTDYLLYEILGGIDPTDTRPFVDAAKSIGIVFSSAIAVTLWNLAVHRCELGGWSVVLVVLVVLFYLLGREATLAQYRTRALRLYVNFLMMPLERLERLLQRPDEMARDDKKKDGE